MRTVLNAILAIGCLIAVSTNAGAVIESKSDKLERITQKLVAPPFLRYFPLALFSSSDLNHY